MNKNEIKCVFGDSYWFKVGHMVPDTKNQTIIHKIVIESIYDTGDPFDFYVGYNQEGEKLFAVRVRSSNVLYV